MHCTVPNISYKGIVVMLPGFRCSGWWGFFPQVATFFTMWGYQAVQVTFSGTGYCIGSTRITNREIFAKTSILDNLYDARRVVEHFSKLNEKVILFGHSGGGSLAIIMACEYNVEALVTWSPGATFVRWQKKEIYKKIKDNKLCLRDDSTGEKLFLYKEVIDKLFYANEELNVVEKARKIHVPWLLLYCKNDQIVTEEEIKELLSVCKTLRAVSLLTGDHNYSIDNPYIASSWAFLVAVYMTKGWLDEHFS